MNVHFGERLAEERDRLGFSQAEMAQRGGVAVRTYANYEAGEREPGLSALANWQTAGVDSLYIVTGQRSASAMAPDEEMVLAGYRKLDARGRAGVLALIGGMQPPAAPTRTGMVFHGKVGDVKNIEGDYHQNEPVTINVGAKKKRTK